MINFQKNFLIIILVFLFNSIEMLGQITASVSAGCAPLDVVFTPPAGMTTYYWDFDDGSSSEDANPTNKFINPKNPFVVTLRACKTCPVLHSYNIAVFPKPSITTNTVNGCAPLTANLTPSYTLPSGITTTSIKYIYGDGSSETKSSPPFSPGTHSFSSGDYNVTYEIETSPTSAGCNTSATLINAVKASNLQVSMGANPGGGCNAPLKVDFISSVLTDRNIVSYNWNFGSAGSSTLANPSFTFTSQGSYTITITVTDDNNCVRIATTTVDIKPNDMTKIISKDTVCTFPTLLDVSHDGSSSLITNGWVFSGASSAGNSTSRNSLVAYSFPGKYTIEVTSFMGPSCPKTVTKEITVFDPKLKISVNPQPLCNKINNFTISCLNSNILDSIKWYLDGKLISTKYSDNIKDTIKDLDTITWQFGFKTLTAKGYTKYGCEVSIDSIIISPLIAHISPITNTFGCVPLKVGFVDKTTKYRKDTIVSWKIDFGDGTVQTFNKFDTIWHTYTKRDTYDLKMIAFNKYGCFDTTYVTKISVGDKHNIDFTISPNGGLCASDPASSISLTSLVSSDSAQMTKFWSDGFQCHQSKTLTYKPDKNAGVVPVTMEVGDWGCFSSVTKNIYIKGPVAKFTQSQLCDSPRKVVFNNQSQEATRYLWNFGDGNTSTSISPNHKYTADGFYTVTLTAFNDTNSCPPDVYTLTIQIQTPNCTLLKDSFNFCFNEPFKLVDGTASGFYNTDGHTGMIWEFKNASPFRSNSASFDYERRFSTLNITEPYIDTVYFTVRNFMNCTKSDTASIIVDYVDLRILKPKDKLVICNNDTIPFLGIIKSRHPIKKTVWDFGDGQTVLDKLDTFHIYKNLTKYSILAITLLAETELNCINDTFTSLKMKDLGLKLDTNSQNACFTSSTKPATLLAYTDTACKFQWKIPDGSIINGNPITYNFPYVDTFDFEVYVVDTGNKNCVDTLYTSIIARKKPDLYILSNKDTLKAFCDPLSLDLTYIDSNFTTIDVNRTNWKYTNTSGTQNFNRESISVPLLKGINTFTVIAFNEFCSDTTTRIFDVKAPSGEISIDPNNICKGDTIQFNVKNLIDASDFSIDFGDGNSSDNISPIKHKYNYVPIGGKTKAKATFSINNKACVGKPIDTTIFIYEVFAKFGIDYNAFPDTPICFRPVHIKDSSLGANSYKWDFGDGSFLFSAEPGFHTFPNPGKYYLSLITANTQYGCKDTFRDSLVLLPKPKSNPTNDTICLGSKARVFQINSIMDSINYIWSPKDSFLLSIIDTNYSNVRTDLNYTLIAKSKQNGCADSASAKIIVIKKVPNIIFDTILSPGQDIALPHIREKYYLYKWIPDSFLSCTDCDNPVAQYLLNPITYTVPYRDAYKNCFPDTSIYKIRIVPDILVNAPTAFTPNGDGVNDIFYARGFGIKKLTSFKIFNRQGQLLFFSTSENDGWDGNYNGIPQNGDTYFYTIKGESYIIGKVVTKEGNFMLIR